MRKSTSLCVVTYLATFWLAATSQLAGAQVQFVMAWGGNVNANGTTPDLCEDADSCQAGAYSDQQGHFKNPSGVTTDNRSNIYVADEYNHRIQKFDSNGNFVLAWGTKGGLGGQFLNPWGITIDAKNNVYVVDSKNHRIQKFDSDGKFLLAWGGNVDSSGTTPNICDDAVTCQAGTEGAMGGQFKGPANVAVDINGNVYVTDMSNQRVQKFDSDGSFKLAWGYNVDTSSTTPNICENAPSCQAGTRGGEEGRFNYPDGIAVNANGEVYVVNWGNNRVQKFDSNGNFKMAWGSTGGLGGQFVYPAGAAMDKSNNIYVIGRSYRVKNHRVQKFGSKGEFIVAWGGNVDTSGTTPGICEDAALCQSGAKGALGGQFNDPTGVAVDAAGNVFVADRSNHRIQKFSVDAN